MSLKYEPSSDLDALVSEGVLEGEVHSRGCESVRECVRVCVGERESVRERECERE